MSIITKKSLIISGPCSAETEEQTLATCRQLAATGKVDILRAGIWKPRTRPGCFEGAGVKALAWLAQAKKETGLPIAVEVASAKHVEMALEFGVDMVWIGARTTVNPFSVQEIADSLRNANIPVLIKNPMNPDIELWQGAVQRLQAVGIEDIGLIHRGFSTYGQSRLRNEPMWHIAIEMKRRMPELPMICDPSHIAGNRDYLLEIAQKGADLNYSGMIIESHICPTEAWSDAEQQVTPDILGELVDSIQWRQENNNQEAYLNALEGLRSQIDNLDSEIFSIFAKRMGVADKIGEIKKANNVAILQTGRWSDIIEKASQQSKKLGLSEDFMMKVLDAIHVESISRQNEVMNRKK